MRGGGVRGQNQVCVPKIGPQFPTPLINHLEFHFLPEDNFSDVGGGDGLARAGQGPKPPPLPPGGPKAMARMPQSGVPDCQVSHIRAGCGRERIESTAVLGPRLGHSMWVGGRGVRQTAAQAGGGGEGLPAHLEAPPAPSSLDRGGGLFVALAGVAPAETGLQPNRCHHLHGPWDLSARPPAHLPNPKHQALGPNKTSAGLCARPNLRWGGWVQTPVCVPMDGPCRTGRSEVLTGGVFRGVGGAGAGCSASPCVCVGTPCRWSLYPPVRLPVCRCRSGRAFGPWDPRPSHPEAPVPSPPSRAGPRRRSGLPQPPPPSPDQRDHREKQRNFPLGRSDGAIFGAQPRARGPSVGQGGGTGPEARAIRDSASSADVAPQVSRHRLNPALCDHA